MDIFNLDLIIQRVNENVQGEEGGQMIAQPKHRGTHVPLPTDRSLRSKVKLSSSSVAALSND